MSMSAAHSKSHEHPDPAVNAVIRNLLRVSLSAKEYKVLHDYVIKRSSSIQKHAPSPSQYEAVVRSSNKYNVAAIRASLRVFLLTGGGLSLAELVTRKLRGSSGSSTPEPRIPFIRSAKFRVALSFSLLLLLHRILHRFFVLLRANLRTDDAKPFRDRNPRVSKALTSRYAPAVGASLAGLALGICPGDRVRITIAIYAATRSLEFLYNTLDEKDLLKKKPWWFGSWLLMPVSCAQLFHAFILDRETIPTWIGDAILKFSPSYIPSRPEGFPTELPWPDKYEIVDSLGSIADLKWPLFISPILHPTKPITLPRQVQSISPVTSPAHPGIASLSCALLHPSTPSCGTAFLHHVLNSVPPLARTITLGMLALSAIKYKAFLANPVAATNIASKRVLSLTAILSASVGSLWGSICLLNSLIPRSTLPTKRFFLSGALAGLPFAFIHQGRGIFLYIFRSAIYSAWETGVKRGLWRRWKGGELWVLVLSWALLGAVLEECPEAVQSAGFRKALVWMRGDGLVDPVEVAARRRQKTTSETQIRSDPSSIDAPAGQP